MARSTSNDSSAASTGRKRTKAADDTKGIELDGDAGMSSQKKTAVTRSKAGRVVQEVEIVSKPKSPRKKQVAVEHNPKPWLASYPEGIPHEIGPFTHVSLVDLMLEACERYSDRTAFLSMGKGLTFADTCFN